MHDATNCRNQEILHPPRGTPEDEAHLDIWTYGPGPAISDRPDTETQQQQTSQQRTFLVKRLRGRPSTKDIETDIDSMSLPRQVDSVSDPFPAAMHRKNDDGQGAAAMAALVDWSPIATTVLSPALCILRASHSLCEAWRLPSVDAFLGRDIVTLLRELGLLASDDDATHFRLVLQTAAEQTAVSTISTPDTALAPVEASDVQQQPWHGRIVPIARDGVLLMLLVEWTQLLAPGPPDLGTDQPSPDHSHSPVQPVPEHTKAKPSLRTAVSADDYSYVHILIQTVKDYAIFLLDVDGNIATWNAGAELNKGYTRDEIIGKHFSIFYGADDLAARKPWRELEDSLRDGHVEDEGWRIRKDGSRFWANVTITPIHKDGVHVGFGKVTRDLTERRAAEQRVIAACEESAKLKSAFLANMSHEIRTPMHGMLSACSLLLHTALTPDQRDIASIIDESGQVLLRIINDILDYSKLASGNVSTHTDLVDLAAIVTAVARSVQATLNPDVRLQLVLARDLPPAVQGDLLRYRQIVQNIVANAVKFTDWGDIRIDLSVRHDDGDALVILTTVTDTGIGIPAAAAKSLFVPFTQVDVTTKKRYQGTGLGLSICKSLVELMHGDIGYEPNPVQTGSVFWFTARFRTLQNSSRTQPPPEGKPVGEPLGPQSLLFFGADSARKGAQARQDIWRKFEGETLGAALPIRETRPPLAQRESHAKSILGASPPATLSPSSAFSTPMSTPSSELAPLDNSPSMDTVRGSIHGPPLETTAAASTTASTTSTTPTTEPTTREGRGIRRTGGKATPTWGRDPDADQLQKLRERVVGRHLLIAEDNLINQRVLLRFLEVLGVDRDCIVVASDGAQAVAYMRSATIASAACPPFDLVLMDINMPVMDGFEATVRIRQDGSNVPILAMTAHALQGDREQCLSYGMNDYIAKPVNKGLLVDKLLAWLPERG